MSAAGSGNRGPGTGLGLWLAVLAAVWIYSRRRIADFYYGTRLYRFLLRGAMPDRLLRVPDELWPGRADRADAMMRGEWVLEGRTLFLSQAHPFDAKAPDDQWFAGLHGFGWLRDFHAYGGDTGERAVRALVREWISRYAEPGGASTKIWGADIIARRLVAWATHARMVLDSSDLVFRSQVLRAMVRQAAHLSRLAKTRLDSDQRFAAGIGLSFAGLVIPDSSDYLRQGLALVRSEASRQILPDGGHISRSPAALASMLQDLITLKAALIQARSDVPDAIQIAIDRATPMLRFFRHGDGGLAQFNGASGFDDALLDRIASQADARGRPLNMCPHSGYGRLLAKRTLIIMDVGAPPPFAASIRAHAACNAFEFSVGRHRVVTNCGDGQKLGEDWGRLSRRTAAHSALTLNDESQFQILGGRWEAWLGPRPYAWSGHVSADRQEDAQGSVLDGLHSLYANRFGLRHQRRIFMDPEGSDIRGEDVLDPLPNRKFWQQPPQNRPFAVRFHLHPDVRISLARDQRSALLVLPNSDGWVFRASGAKMALEESVYLADSTAPRRTMQIILTGQVEKGQARIKWAFKRG